MFRHSIFKFKGRAKGDSELGMFSRILADTCFTKVVPQPRLAKGPGSGSDASDPGRGDSKYLDMMRCCSLFVVSD